MNWQQMYEIKQGEAFVDDGDIGSHYAVIYLLVDKYTGEERGRYKTYKYAIKQAKYKYKKFVKLVERNLTG
jgi:hypothetical protein